MRSARPAQPARAALAAVALAVLSAACTGKYVRPTTQEKVTPTPDLLARGNYLVNSISMCGVCHTPRVGGSWLGGERADAFLAGGSVFDDDVSDFKIAVPNITQDKDTGIGAWTDDEIARSIRDGIHRDGRLLMPPMPFSTWGIMADDDVRAIVAYLRTVPPVRNQVNRDGNDLPFMMGMAHSMGAMHHKPAQGVKAPPTTDKLAYGNYLARISVCHDCHSLTKTGPSEDNLLAGSKIAFGERGLGKIWARNLTPDKETGLGNYTAPQIKESLRSGKRLDGKPMLVPMSLVIPHLSTWADEDLDALVAFIRSIPAKKYRVPEPEVSAAARKAAGL